MAAALSKIIIAGITNCIVIQPTWAACQASAGTTPAIINYGSVPSQNVPAGGISLNGNGVDAVFSVTCSVTLSLQLLSISSWLRYTAQQPLTLSNGTNTIGYTLASNSTFNPSITTAGQSIGGSTGFQLLTLGILTSGRVDVPLHTTTSTTSLWPNAGTYTGTQVLTVDGSMCTGIGIGDICLGTTPVNSTVTFSLRLDVSKSCEFISSPALVDFGLVGFLDAVNTAQLSTVLRCTYMEDYLLYADNGDHYANGSRRMTKANGASVQYQVFQPGSTTNLLSITTPLSRTGTGASETISIPLKITAGQATPAAGIYSDNLRMVIEY